MAVDTEFHSERRNVYNESEQLCADRAQQVFDQKDGTVVVFCIGEQKEDREGGTTMRVCKKQYFEKFPVI